MRELDILLSGHLERHGDTLTGHALDIFERLLASTDMDLYGWFTGRETSHDAELAALVTTIVHEAPSGRRGAQR